MIVITSMDVLPERCYDCPLCHETYCTGLKINESGWPYQSAQEIRPYNCPLKEVTKIKGVVEEEHAIDLDAFREVYDLREHCEDCGRRNKKACDYPSYSAMDFCSWLDDAPTVDAVPVVHGKWEWLSSTYDRTPCEKRYRCSECHHETITHDHDPWEKYCPNCGAKMDLEEHNGTDKAGI